MRTAATERLGARIDERERVLRAFVGAERERIARACHAIARSFARGGTLICFGTGAAATDAAHAAVEFMHPVIVGKRALPALAPSNDPSGASALPRLARGDDIALAISHSADDPAAAEFLAEARRRGLLTIWLTAAAESGSNGAASLVAGADPGGLDFRFVVPSDDPAIVQEVQETAYHVLWELVHVFFEHPGLLDDACITCGDVAVEADVVAVSNGTAMIEKDGLREEVATDLVEGVAVGDRLLCHAGVALEKVPAAGAGEVAGGSAASQPAPAGDETALLYPFLEREERDVDSVLADVAESTARKAEDVIEMRRAIDPAAIEACAAAIGERLRGGGRLLAFGNGGSSTDAQDLAVDCLGAGWPAVALNNDVATVTAVGNDVGFDNVFARQIISLGGPRDVAVAISTSGSSANVVVALEEARRRRLLTVAIVGYDGGRLAGAGWLDHLLVVRADYIPRIQEAQATIYHLLVDALGPAPGAAS